MAQSIEAEEDRYSDHQAPSIISSLPPDLADPFGIRSRLARDGIDFHVNYIGEGWGNPTGGVKQGAYYDGRLELAVTADMEKMVGWKGLTFFANAFQIHGQSISAENLGVLMTASYIEALPSTRLFELWLEQKLFSDRLSIRIGQLSADSEFMVSEGSQGLLNGTWGWPGIAGVNMPDGGPHYPTSAPGVRASLTVDPQLTLLAALYTGAPAGDCTSGPPEHCNPYGVLFPLTDPLLFLEADFKHHQGEGQLAGSVKIGSWRLFGNPEQQSIGGNALPIALPAIPGEIADEDYALYLVVDQMIYRVPGTKEHRGVGLFGNVIMAPSSGNMSQSYFEAGITFTGVLDQRPHDIFAVGYANTGVSTQIQQYEQATGSLVIPNYEAVLEASYTAEIVPGFYVQPDFQYFWNPGGHVADPNDPANPVPNAVVVGLRTTINY